MQIKFNINLMVGRGRRGVGRCADLMKINHFTIIMMLDLLKKCLITLCTITIFPPMVIIYAMFCVTITSHYFRSCHRPDIFNSLMVLIQWPLVDHK